MATVFMTITAGSPTTTVSFWYDQQFAAKRWLTLNRFAVPHVYVDGFLNRSSRMNGSDEAPAAHHVVHSVAGWSPVVSFFWWFACQSSRGRVTSGVCHVV
jgi:hypothetical protein